MQNLKNLHKKLLKNIEFLNLKTAYYYNSKRFRKPLLQKKNKIYLLRQNIKTTRPSDKLNHKKLKLFKILRNIKNTTYELHLLLMMKIHSVFHISLLKSAAPDA